MYTTIINYFENNRPEREQELLRRLREYSETKTSA